MSKAVFNSLKILAARGDQQAIEALARSQELGMSVLDDDHPDAGDIKVVLEWSDGMHIITDYGASFIPNEVLPEAD
ncbi:MAG: hypothetical protein HC886_01935 [Leptolyngbyaceae cyanobacterium SM1_1_3]|nr:hypothetical protein [Leptolyngbyaceae cyanobacterium SM1_1_3]